MKTAIIISKIFCTIGIIFLGYKLYYPDYFFWMYEVCMLFTVWYGPDSFYIKVFKFFIVLDEQKIEEESKRKNNNQLAPKKHNGNWESRQPLN